MRLVDDLAYRRTMYSRPLATMPDILLIDIPPHFASPSLPLGRYYPVNLETEVECVEMQTFLSQDRARPVVPDIFDRRPSALLADDVMFARCRPPHLNWPWILLCRWPPRCMAKVPPGEDLVARGAYTTEIFATIAEVDAAETQLLTALHGHSRVALASQPKVLGHT